MTEGVGVVVHAHALDHRSNGLAVGNHGGLLSLQGEGDQFVCEKNLGLALNAFLGRLTSVLAWVSPPTGRP